MAIWNFIQSLGNFLRFYKKALVIGRIFRK